MCCWPVGVVGELASSVGELRGDVGRATCRAALTPSGSSTSVINGCSSSSSPPSRCVLIDISPALPLRLPALPLLSICVPSSDKACAGKIGPHKAQMYRKETRSLPQPQQRSNSSGTEERTEGAGMRGRERESSARKAGRSRGVFEAGEGGEGLEGDCEGGEGREDGGSKLEWELRCC